jgi:hypothetical protein
MSDNDPILKCLEYHAAAGGEYTYWGEQALIKYAALKADADSLNALFDMQHGRVREAEQLWRDNNPGNELVMPDLGKLVQWLVDDRAKYKADADRLAHWLALIEDDITDAHTLGSARAALAEHEEVRGK